MEWPQGDYSGFNTGLSYHQLLICVQSCVSTQYTLKKIFDFMTTFWCLPARSPVLEVLRCKCPVPHVEVCDHATWCGTVQFVCIVAPQQIDLQEQGEGNLEIFEVFIHMVDIQKVSILKGAQVCFQLWCWDIFWHWYYCLTNTILASFPLSQDKHMWFQTNGLKML